ncbi:OLC1v1036941C1 [Oldenlandia corymbosa var. corymbosa]|uniref:OLC1v1036941C1 n=1 Tax=Oldenlandia corymbosa var. corymbosa TaxID=529605 RepID=A0AAV1CXY3_OLDCO|nr:OLC1v1036941C1 [Oldenlandia corymbosa var. corymbosa]
MEELFHNSHPEHPLKPITKLHHDESAGTSKSCNGCRKPLRTKAGEPYFSCEECQFFLHKRCAEMPSEIQKHPLHPKHKLALFASPPSSYSKCDACRGACESFVYHCSICWFDLHIWCAFPETKLDHPSHEHPLVCLQKPSIFTCDACGGRDEQQSYVCAQCHLWIHMSCALLPSINYRNDHNHPFSLAYSVPTEFLRHEIPCEFCFKEIPFYSWVYYCSPCRYIFHLGCFGNYRNSRTPRIVTPGTLKLPTSNFVEVIKEWLQVRRKEILQDPKVVNPSRCEHSLVSVNLENVSNSNDKEIVCKVCTEPIVSFCGKCEQCNYFFHFTCAQLPKEIDPSHHERGMHKLQLCFLKNVWGKIICDGCGLDCNGYFYKCSTCFRGYHLDVKCALLPYSLMHMAHRHNLPLHQNYGNTSSKCRSCGVRPSWLFFSCGDCEFFLDYECVTLPETVKHRWDKHPLQLSFPPFSDRPEEFYCEICEEEIHPKRWHYHCKECDRSFHPNCIPKIRYRNCIFGATLEYGKHPHALRFVREGYYYSKCDSCRKLMHGKRVFECASCRFCICLSCVSEVAKSGKVIGPDQISE